MKESLEINIDIELEKARDGAWVASIPTSNSAYWSASAANSAARSVAEKLKQIEIIKEML